MIKTLTGQIKQYKRDTILTPIFTALEVIMEVLIPYVTARIIDLGISQHNMHNVWKYGIMTLVMALFGLLFGTLAGVFDASASTGFARNLRQSMFENIQRFSFSNIDKFSTAGLVTRMTTDITNVQMAFMMVLRIAVRAPLMMIVSLIMCIVISPKISLIFLVVLVFVGVFLGPLMKKVTVIFRKMFDQYDLVNADVQENVSGIRVVKAYVREDYENSKMFRAAKRLYDLAVAAQSRTAIVMPVMMLAIYGAMIGVSWFGAKFIVAGSMTTGELTSLFSYVMSVLISLMMLGMIIVMLVMSNASAQRITEVLEEEPDIVNPENPVMEVPNGSVDFDHVDFSYKTGTGEKTLQDIDLHIRSGETIGVIGGTGSGKSSLVSLISRLYDVDTGSVRVGGRDVREYDLETLRDKVAVVLQKNELFTGSILDNLRWGKEDATLEECQRVCRVACADEFIDRFPDGYNTHIEQGGSNVSGGQKQRLCIARALLKDPNILILDDSTSAVDTATDAKIRAAFRNDLPETTKIIISQRISSVQDADRILVLDDGRISGFDTHENLLQGNAIYKDIYDVQMKAGGDFDQAN
ncbi:MAG: ABC transporter ATP-binding protein [Oscillospiraceae bacterium]|nr:ABC transporter ATP-binding protein [Oscillospiraceae bacterium]